MQNIWKHAFYLCPSVYIALPYAGIQPLSSNYLFINDSLSCIAKYARHICIHLLHASYSQNMHVYLADTGGKISLSLLYSKKVLVS